jgi:hypothetical protein
MRERYVATNGIRLFCVEVGEGPLDRHRNRPGLSGNVAAEVILPRFRALRDEDVQARPGLGDRPDRRYTAASGALRVTPPPRSG